MFRFLLTQKHIYNVVYRLRNNGEGAHEGSTREYKFIYEFMTANRWFI